MSSWFIGQRVRTIRNFTSTEGPGVPIDAYGEVIALHERHDRCTVRFFELKAAEHRLLGSSEIEPTEGWYQPRRADTLGPAGHRHVRGTVRIGGGMTPLELVVDLDQRAHATRQLRDLAELLALREELRCGPCSPLDG